MAPELQRLLHWYRWEVIFMLIGVLCSIAGLVLFLSFIRLSTKPTDPSSINSASVTQTIQVDIAGAVRTPGIFALTENSRVEDLIVRAGGITTEADSTYMSQQLNRARVLQDQEKVYIPYQKTSKNTTHPIEYEPADEKISINDASLSDLETLPHIGPKTAQKIIDNRPYLTIQDLQTKKVIGNKLFSAIENSLQP